MSAIFAPAVIYAISGNYKESEIMKNEKSSEDNLDFIVTLLNTPTEKTKEMDELIHSEESSPSFLVIQDCQTIANCPQTTTTITETVPADRSKMLAEKKDHQPGIEMEVFRSNHNNFSKQLIQALTTDPAAASLSAKESMEISTEFMTANILDNVPLTKTITNRQTHPTSSAIVSDDVETPTTYQCQNEVSLPLLLKHPFLLTRTLHKNDISCAETEALDEEQIAQQNEEVKNIEDMIQKEQEENGKMEEYQIDAMTKNSDDYEREFATKIIEDENEGTIVEHSTQNIECVEIEECEADDDDDADEDDLTNLNWLTELRSSSINPKILDDNLESTEPINKDVYHTLQSNYTHLNKFANNSINANNSQKAINKFGANQNTLNFKMLQQISNKIAASTNGSAKANAAVAQVKRPTPAERYQIFMDKVNRDLQEYKANADSYQTDHTEKPPFNYSHIIGMVMLEKGRVTLQQICSWIESKFAFFRVRKKWNNSIRHNLSLHHCFRKINRNKDEKGKGGYWELGVDLKKCDRKRIRNRKSANSNIKNKTRNKSLCINNSNKHINDINLKTCDNLHNTSESALMSGATVAAAAAATTSVAVSIQAAELRVAGTTAITKTRTSTPETLTQLTTDLEMHLDVQLPAAMVHPDHHLLLDDLDVQQNVDISSNQQQKSQHQFHHHHHQLPQEHQHPINTHQIVQNEDAFIANALANYIETDINHDDSVTFNAQTDMTNSPNTRNAAATTLTLTSDASLPQYQLGTVIISTTADDIASIDVSNALNSFIYNNAHNSTNANNNHNKHNNSNLNNNEYRQSQSQEHEVLYQEDEIPPACENIIISSFLTDVMDTHSPSASSGAAIPNRPNVIVEPLEPYYSVIPIVTAATTASANTASGDPSVTSSQGGNNYRPYIDGIDEAFQYLRSMDNNRSEDLLDNLLDISVSDY